jgi:hypothetical protein
MIIFTPSGLCPVQLRGTDIESVNTWAEKLREYGYSQQKEYTYPALRYWVRQFYEIGSAEYEAICELLGD